jgi:hypothetical protein
MSDAFHGWTAADIYNPRARRRNLDTFDEV